MLGSSESWGPQQRPLPWRYAPVEEPSTASFAEVRRLYVPSRNRYSGSNLEAAVAVDQQREWVELELTLKVGVKCPKPPLLRPKGDLLPLLRTGKFKACKRLKVV